VDTPWDAQDIPVAQIMPCRIRNKGNQKLYMECMGFIGKYVDNDLDPQVPVGESIGRAPSTVANGNLIGALKIQDSIHHGEHMP